MAGQDGLRLLVEQTLQRVLEEELTALAGGVPHERTEARRGHRSGHTARMLRTRVGSLELGGPYPQVAQMLEEEGEQILTVFHLPAVHRRRMASTNMLERLNHELRRRTRVVRIFPNTVSCLRLVCALAIETNQEWMARRYLDMEVEEGAEREAA
jgi:transposase-like protein